MSGININAKKSSHEPIRRENAIFVVGIILVAVLATMITLHFDTYTLNISCEREQVYEKATCQVIKVNLFNQKAVLFDKQKIATASITQNLIVSNNNYSVFNRLFYKKWCKAQLYDIYGEVLWKTEYYNIFFGQSCFGYDDSNAFIGYLENHQPVTGAKLTHHYQLVVHKHWNSYLLSFIGWIFLCSMIYAVYGYIRLRVELRRKG